MIEDVKTTSRIEVVQKSFGNARADASLDTSSRMHSNRAISDFYKNTDFTEKSVAIHKIIDSALIENFFI